MKKLNLSSIGFLQALGVIVYCALIGGLLQILEKTFVAAPGITGIILILTLLVFSAAITGSLVFGYAAYLALNKEIKQALSVFAYTMLYCLGFIGIIIIVLTIVA